jgi:hypothetical protein
LSVKVVKHVAQVEIERKESATTISVLRRARVIVDLSRTKLSDRPAFLEEKLSKAPGIVSAEINAFSNRLTVEFDPSLINIEKIRSMISASSLA